MKLKYLLFVFLVVYMHGNGNGQYICPPCNMSCDTLEFKTPGKCNHCNMTLIAKKSKLDRPLKIAFYLQDGVEVLDFAGPMEVFAYAGYEVFTVSKTKDIIISQGILKIVPDYSIDNAPFADVLAFFGGNASSASNDKSVINWIKKQPNIDYYFTVCTGAFILAESGLLNGKTATTFHRSLNRLEKNYPKVNVKKNVRFVDNGNIVTTAGISAGIDGALHFVAKLEGLEVAKSIAQQMEYDKWIPGEGLILTNENINND